MIDHESRWTMYTLNQAQSELIFEQIDMFVEAYWRSQLPGQLMYFDLVFELLEAFDFRAVYWYLRRTEAHYRVMLVVERKMFEVIDSFLSSLIDPDYAIYTVERFFPPKFMRAFCAFLPEIISHFDAQLLYNYADYHQFDAKVFHSIMENARVEVDKFLFRSLQMHHEGDLPLEFHNGVLNHRDFFLSQRFNFLTQHFDTNVIDTYIKLRNIGFIY